jgi:hypothetical protein
MNDVQKLKEVLLNGNPMLFLGAGFSYGSKNSYGTMATGNILRDEIYNIFVKDVIEDSYEMEVKQFTLQELCGFVNDHLKKKDELKDYLIKRFQDVEPATFHYLLSNYPWKKIYTVNIDDLVEHICHKNHIEFVVQNTSKEKPVKDELEYVKLHGCVNEPNEPFIFSKTEYDNLISSRMNYKHNNLISDIQNENFIFVGASLDERDIDYYISQYENAGHFRKGKLFFIEPYPTLKLQMRAEKLEGTIIKWTTEEFLKFIEKINFNPTESEKRKMRLIYSGIYPVKDILNSVPRDESYESKLYEGYNSSWHDLKEGWLFEPSSIYKIYEKINQIDFSKNNNYCLALYGNAFCGKDCILKLVGSYLEKKGVEVLEFKGKKLDIRVIREYISNSTNENYALLVENASYYYKVIEKILQMNTGKHILVVTTSRNYYHMKKKYYLEGNPYEELKIEDSIDRVSAKNIYIKLKEKGYLGNISTIETTGTQEIIKEKNYINLFTTITYGSGFKKRLKKTSEEVLESNPEIKNLYIELTVFDKADLPYYPSELLTARYSIDFELFVQKKYKELSREQALIVDFVKLDEQGVRLKNVILTNEVWGSLSRSEKKYAIVHILKEISPYVEENENNYWKIIFECILKEDCLERKFGLKLKEILSIYYQLKEEFSDISYYWLQLGIAEQKCNEYNKAMNHLNMAHVIRPKAYQIQHAIGRNYLKYANYLNDSIQAEALFKQGEEIMLELINSSEYYKEKAKNYSIHCYVLEKIQYIKRHKKQVSNRELLQIKQYIDMIKDDKDVYIDSMVVQYMSLLKKLNKLDIISMRPDDIYFKALGKKDSTNDVQDVLVESY